MILFLPSVLRGPWGAAFAGLLVSTSAPLLIRGAGYLGNVSSRRFVRRDAAESHYVMASRLATALLTVVSAAVAFRIESIGGGWRGFFISPVGAGGALLCRRVLGWCQVGGGNTHTYAAADLDGHAV